MDIRCYFLLMATLFFCVPQTGATGAEKFEESNEFLYGPDFLENIPEGERPPETFQVVIDPYRNTKLSTEIQSPVKKIHKRMGETFKKGEPLIDLDEEVFIFNLEKNKAAYEKARVDLEGKKELFNDNVASLIEVKEAEAELASAKSDLSFAEKNIEATTITAPYDGKVVSLEVEEHELPEKGAKVIELINDTSLIASLLIPSSLLKKIYVGMPFEIELQEAGKTITVKISRIGAVIDPSSSTIRIEADIDNSDGVLWTGMTGTADFTQAEVEAPVKKAKTPKTPPARNLNRE